MNRAKWSYGNTSADGPMPEDPNVQMSFAEAREVYTTSSPVRFAVCHPNGGFGQVVVDIEPGETKTVTLPPNGKRVTIHRPLLTDGSQDA